MVNGRRKVRLGRRRGEGRVFPAPLDVVLSDFDVVEPDLVVFTGPFTERLPEGAIQGAPDLVVEILSPSTAGRDRGLKRGLYEKFGVQEYWIVDPDERRVEVLRHEEGRLEEGARLGVGERLTTPLLPGLEIGLRAVLEA